MNLNDLRPFTLGEFIRFRREQMGFTQEYVARRLDVSERQYRNWEIGKNKPSIDNLMALLKTFNLRLQDIESVLEQSNVS